MATNQSSREKTVKSMFQLLKNDVWTIDRTLLYSYYDKSNIYVVGNILDNYRDYFDQFLEEVELPERFYYQPAAFSEYLYGTPDLDFLILYFARIATMLDFKKPKIMVLPRTRLTEINKLMTEYKNVVDSSYNNPSPPVL